MTIKKKRTIVSALLAVFATTSMTATAFAASFSFHLSSGGDEYSAAATKLNTRSYATVSVDDGNFVNSDRLYLRVCENQMASDGVYYFATETKWVNNAPYTLTLNYYTGEAVYGNRYRLRGYQDGPLSVRANGTWTP